MYSNLRNMLDLPESTSQAALCKACNECYWMYNNIASTSSDARIKELAKKKIDTLVTLMGQEGIKISCTELYDGKSVHNSVTSAESELAGATTKALAQNKRIQIENLIKAMPVGAHKEYLLASLNKATSGFNKDDVDAFVNGIKTAQAMDETNPIYDMILADIDAEIEKYNVAYKVWKQQKEEKEACEHRKQMAKSIFKGAGSVILAILGGIGSIFLGLFGCLCECCDGC